MVAIRNREELTTMIAAIDKSPISFDEFIDWYPENSENRYELRRGLVIEMPKPRGKHSRLAGDLAFDLGTAIRQAKLPYFIPKECVIKIGNDTGYEHDIVVLLDNLLFGAWRSALNRSI
jgi:Uma2 family endonuclease